MVDSKLDKNGNGSRKRRRQTIVCVNCRRRKTKCDKGKPCESCVKLGLQETCSYIPDLGSQLLQRKSLDFSFEIPHFEASYINLIPAGLLVNRKRSGTGYVAPLTAAASIQRDVYLRVLRSVCATPKFGSKKSHKRKEKHSTAAQTTTTTATATVGDHKKEQDNPSCSLEEPESPMKGLPNSLRHIKKMEEEAADLSDDLAAKHWYTCKRLFEKFGASRKNRIKSWNGTETPFELIPEATVFFQHVWPYYVDHVWQLCPVFNLSTLETKIHTAYAKSPQQKYGIDDFACYCTILLITRIVQVSIELSGRADDYPIIKSIETECYIPIVHHFLLRGESIRKCSLFGLQAMLLLRFYQWCAPDDGDGEYLQQSSMLMGMIVSGSYGIGLGWHCLTQIGDFVTDRNIQCAIDPTQTLEEVKEYQRVWCEILHWDRKISLLTGLPCLIGTTMRVNNNEHDGLSLPALSYDFLLEKISRTISSCPTKVDFDLIMRLSGHLKQMMRNDSKDNVLNPVHAHEMNLVLLLLELSLEHARVVNCEIVQHSDEYRDCIQALMEKILEVTNFCQYLLNRDEVLAPARFYTNRIVELALRGAISILPSIILRSGRSSEAKMKATLTKFYKATLSAYFNSLGTDYYQAFRRMFNAKILFKTLKHLNETDPFQTILEFYAGSSKDSEAMAAPQPSEMQKFRDRYDQRDGKVKLGELWDSCLNMSGGLFSFELDIENLVQSLPFTQGLSENEYDLFDAFFSKASSQFLETVKLLPSACVTDSPENIFDNFDYTLLDFGTESHYDPLIFLDFFKPAA
ncbi:LAFA_0G04852g1_1 [Lachancea sp. 'fantastica']|nr:LAFA_0G04852g1_1 [Lachancea sp. 'fantastica']